MVEIPNEIAVYFEIGGCIQKCPNCHSSYHQGRGDMVDMDYLQHYAEQQATQGATAIVLMGGTTSKYISKQELNESINKLSLILPVGLYSGTEIDDIFMSNHNLRWYKTGAYVDSLGGLTSTKTNQRFYQRTKSEEWELKNDLFQTPTQQQEKHLDL